MTGAAALAPALRDAARMVARVAAGRSLADELGRSAEEGVETPRAALVDLTHGTLRRYGRVQAIVAALSRRGAPDPAIQALLWCALYALESGRYAQYTVVDQAVRACALLERWTAKGYVNGLLRSYLRERAALEARLRMQEEARYQHPKWWIELVRAAHPEAWEAILAAGNLHPPMTLRVNARRTSTADYLRRLEAHGIAARAVGESALLLERALPVERLPGFDAGEVSVQDAGAQRAAPLLDLAPGQRVLDACAAPGGKTAHLAELTSGRADVSIDAVERDPERARRIADNLQRTKFAGRVSIRVDDAVDFAGAAGAGSFDRVLLDAPCTASGIVRRHPDIPWLRRPADVAQLATEQARLLDALWPCVAPAGRLLYVVCSVFPDECTHQVDRFVRRFGDARPVALAGTAHSQQTLLPSPSGRPAVAWTGAGLPTQHDGFFYALFEKS